MDVLIVDDEESLLTSLSIVFQESGFEVSTARSVPGAIARLQSKVPDAVIVDKNLPDFSGGDLVRHIRETYGDVPILLITAFATASNAKEMLNLGVDEYLEKPFPNVYSVVGAVREMIKKRSQRKQNAPAAPSPGHRLLVISSASRDVFAALGLPFDVASTGQEILAALDSSTPTIVLIDSTSFPSQETVGIVGMVRRRSTSMSIVVFSETPLKMELLRNLIGAGVDRLAETKQELNELLTTLQHH